MEPDNPASSPPPAVESPSSIARGASAPPARFAALHTLGRTVLTLLLYAALADAAIETFVHGSPGRGITAGAVAAYAVLTALFWRRSSWSTRAVASWLMLLFLLVLTAWLPDGVTRGIVLAGQRTSTVLALVTALAILLAGVALAGSRVLPLPARWAAGIISAYGTAACLVGIVAGTDYPDLFQGVFQRVPLPRASVVPHTSLWARLPFWLQGAFAGAVILVPAAIAFQVVIGLRGGPRQNSLSMRRHGLQVAGLTASVLVAVAGMMAPASPGLTRFRPNIPKPAYHLGPIIFAKGESGCQPVGRADRFQEGIKALYAFFDFQGLKAEDTVKAVWYRGAKQLFKQSVKVSDVPCATPIPKKGRLLFSLKFDDGAPAGGYFLEIYVHDILTKAEFFPIDPAR